MTVVKQLQALLQRRSEVGGSLSTTTQVWFTHHHGGRPNGGTLSAPHHAAAPHRRVLGAGPRRPGDGSSALGAGGLRWALEGLHTQACLNRWTSPYPICSESRRNLTQTPVNRQVDLVNLPIMLIIGASDYNHNQCTTITGNESHAPLQAASRRPAARSMRFRLQGACRLTGGCAAGCRRQAHYRPRRLGGFWGDLQAGG